MFWVQFLTAFNDNVLKMGLVLLVTYGEGLFGRKILIFGLDDAQLNTAGGLLLLLPFLLFSALAGQLADRFAKHKLMRATKLAEVLLMLVAGGALVFAALGNPEDAGAALLLMLFLMGTQSTLFGPIKYAMLPQLLPKPGELVAGNALIETGTYLAVLFGTMTATVLMVGPRTLGAPAWVGPYTLAGGVVFFALVGWWAARMSPPVPAEQPDLKVHWNLLRTTWEAAAIVTRRRDLLLGVLANAWFWGLAACLMALTPSWVAGTLGADEWTATAVNAVFSVGVGVGSLLAARWSRGRIELGLVPFAAFALVLSIGDLALGGAPWEVIADAEKLGLLEVLRRPGSWRLILDLLVASAAGGVFMVPLYSFLLDQGEEGERARVIGALNVLTGVTMVGSLGAVFALLGAGLSERALFGVLALAQLGVACACVVALPVPTMRLIAVLITRIGYRPRFRHLDRIPDEGACLIVANHISYLDFILMMAAVRRRHRFVIWHAFMKIPVFGFLARHYGVIPINSDPRDRRTIVKAFKQVSEALRDGQAVVIFPEGALPYEPVQQPFMRGLDLILKRDPVPVVPVAINGMWGSPYSRKGGRAFASIRAPKRRIWITVGEVVPPEDATRDHLEAVVDALWKQMPDRP